MPRFVVARRSLACACVVVASCAIRPTIAQAQVATPNPAAVPAEPQGAFPDASFETKFGLYVPQANLFAPFYAWDAHMGLDVTLFRKGVHAMTFASTFQTVGTEGIRSRVSVGGTGYLISFGYAHRRSADMTLAAGIAHLSSHLTRDLDEKLDEARRNGIPIPIVDDPDEYNVPFVRWARRWPASRAMPELAVTFEPASFRFNGTWTHTRRPVFATTLWRLVRAGRRAVVAETQHELGANALNVFTLRLELFPRVDAEGRLHLFLSFAPGHGFHVSPNLGGVRDGISFGFRMKFDD